MLTISKYFEKEREMKTKHLILLLAILVLLVSCKPGLLPRAEATIAPVEPTLTNTMMPSNTPTEEPTSTPAPTSTPIPSTPTIEPPPLVLEYLDGVELIYVDKFDTFENWAVWNSQTADWADGVLEIVGQRDWTGALVQYQNLYEGMGVVIEFKQTSGFEYEFVTNAGEWDTDSFRSFGVYGGDSPKADLWQGKNALGGNYLLGNLSLKNDNWYSIMIAIDDDGEFFAVVWDLNDTTRRATYHERIGENWAGQTWKFLLQTNMGTTINIDNFSIFSFDAVK
jgi:hypothetical protein